jgi:hypothetical protein
VVKVYAIVLVAGVIGLLVLILGGSLATSLRRPDRDPGETFGATAKMIVGGAVGFGMGGMSAEFSPLDLAWPMALVIAVVAAVVSMAWVRYAVRQAESG